MIECLVSAVVVCGSENCEVSDTRSVGFIVHAIPDVFIPRKLWHLANLSTEQEVDSQSQGLGHSICCGKFDCQRSQKR